MEKRKSLYDISWKVPEETYRADESYSYSTLAKFNREGFNNLHKLYERVESPSLTFGSVVDTLMTDGLEEFENKFLVSSFEPIPDSIEKIIKELFSKYGEDFRSIDLIPYDNIQEVIIENKYQMNWKPETRVKVLKEKGSEYYDLLSLSMNKTIVDTQTYQDALDCVRELKTSPATKWYFEEDSPFDSDIERFYQLKFKGEWNNIKLRCMADLIIVDHKNKTVIPCDLKTSFKKEWDFYKSFIDWCYYIQAQLYWYIIRQNMDKDDLYKNYELADYRFIVISRNSKKPLVWDYDDTKSTQLECVYGKDKQIICKNWRVIVNELNHYLTNNSEYPIGIKNENNLIEWLNKE